MPEAEHTPTTSRRAMTARLAAADLAAGACAGTATALAAETGQDPHPAWEREAAALRAQASAPGLDITAAEAALDRLFHLRDLIAATPARTLAGAAAQIRLALDADEGGSAPGECELLALKNALTTLAALDPSAAAPPPVAPPSAPAPAIPALLARWAEAELHADAVTDEERGEASDAVSDILWEIAGTPARSASDLAIKAFLLAHTQEGNKRSNPLQPDIPDALEDCCTDNGFMLVGLVQDAVRLSPEVAALMRDQAQA